jgi:glutamyl-Q tRNA(Asp) synthetase
VASYLEARSRNGRWLLRIEDIDPPREQPGATDEILAALDGYGFEWDGELTYQSHSREAHDQAVQLLLNRALAYPCGCSRRNLVDAPHGVLGSIYPGTCRSGTEAEETAIRVLTNSDPLGFEDGLQGAQSQRLERDSGDFIVSRKDGLIAYQLAVVVDDALQEITDIVRGIDLMDSTPRQVWLQQLLGYKQPRYIHIPVAINNRAQKLSKSFGARGIRLDQAAATLVAALQVLRQRPPPNLANSSLGKIWEWAVANWNIDVLRGHTELSVGHIALAQADGDGRKNP